jgi:hypothetical protein
MATTTIRTLVALIVGLAIGLGVGALVGIGGTKTVTQSALSATNHVSSYSGPAATRVTK